jgi:Tfp pilus assembly protein PilO
MIEAICFAVGVLAGAVGMFFVAKNNADKFNDALSMTADEIAAMLKKEAAEEVDLSALKAKVAEMKEKFKK